VSERILEPMSWDPGGELGRRLEAYAEARLTPSLSASSRMRIQVMAAANRRAALVEADRTFGAAEETWTAREVRRRDALRIAMRPRTFWQVWRRPMAAMFAGLLTVGILTGTAWAARAGGPLYQARLWTEMANLPADLIARADAEVSRLQDRIVEAQDASRAGDAVGAEAALAAYSRIVVEAARTSATDPDARTALRTGVQDHVTLLNGMVDSVPPTARPAVEDAIAQCQVALRDLDGQGQPGASPDGAAGTGGQGGGSSGTGGTGGSGSHPNAVPNGGNGGNGAGANGGPSGSSGASGPGTGDAGRATSAVTSERFTWDQSTADRDGLLGWFARHHSFERAGTTSSGNGGTADRTHGGPDSRD